MEGASKDEHWVEEGYRKGNERGVERRGVVGSCGSDTAVVVVVVVVIIVVVVLVLILALMYGPRSA